MPGALEQAGAAREPSTFAPLHTDRIFTGFWPNRSVLRDGATTDYQLRYGLGRQDSMWKGSYNSEVSPYLTLIRRPGLDTYNSQAFPPIKSFYSFHTFSGGDPSVYPETISVLADTANTIFDMTGDLTKTVVMDKAPGAGRAYFLGVGNTLYITDGVENKQIIYGGPWKANTRFYLGDRVASGGYVWQVAGFEWVGINSAKVLVTLSGSQADVLLNNNKTFPDTDPIQLVGTNVPGLNEQSFPFTWQSQGEVLLNGLPSSVPIFPNFTGIGGFVASVRTSGGTSGANNPLSGAAQWVGDNQVLWKNMGPVASDWGLPGPQTAPTVSQSASAQIYPAWQASTFYGRLGPSSNRLIFLTDTNGNVQYCVQLGTTSTPGPPVWQTGNLAITIDGTVHWQNFGPGVWQANTATGGSDIKQVLVTAPGGAQGHYYFIATVSGTTGSNPQWNNAVGSITPDGGQLWYNAGPVMDWSANFGPGTPLTNDNTILDRNGYIQTILIYGKTGTAANEPIWNKNPGGQTQEQAQFQNGPGPGAVWINQGSYSAANTAPVEYAYAWKKAATQDVSAASPRSIQVIRNTGQQVTVQGEIRANPQPGDTVIVYRTLQGGGTLYYLAEFLMPSSGKWTFIDTFPDSALDQDIVAQTGGEGTPLPTMGCGAMAYHLGRIFVAVGDVVWVSSGPDAVNAGSSGNAGFDQFFRLQSKITRFWVTSLGLIVFTVRDSYIFLGSAQDSDPLFVKVYVPNLPLLSYDCFTEYMNSGYLYLGIRLVAKLDPGSGIVEVSFPVANYLLYDVSNYDPATSYLTFHSEGSNETALYLSNGISEWLRMALSTVPENGSAWNPPAILSDGTSAVQSVEVSPGVFRLLVGPQSSGTIRKRNRLVNTDNGRTYSVYSRFGSIAVADPGLLAGLAWMTLTSTMAGTRPEFSALIGEIDGTFEDVPRTHQDPPDLPVATSIRSDRHHFLQGQNPVWCRHFQFAVEWPAEDAFNELLTFTIVGQVIQEMKGS